MEINLFVILFLITYVISLACFEVYELNKEYKMEKYVIVKYDTFWNIWGNLKYYSKMDYKTALNTFKKDNDKINNNLIEGKIVLVRKYID